jgi:predicted phage terminase large subunit-like protein
MAGPGLNLIQDLRADTNMDVVRPIGVKPDGSKPNRMAIQSAKIESGQVDLPRNAPWLGDFLHEVLAFPNVRHDDQVDGVSQFPRWARSPPLSVDDS